MLYNTELRSLTEEVDHKKQKQTKLNINIKHKIHNLNKCTSLLEWNITSRDEGLYKSGDQY